MADRHAPGDHPISVRLPPELKAWTDQAAAQRPDRSRSALIAEALEEKRAREGSH